MSLLGLFGVAFALTVNYGLPLIHVTAGHIVDQRKKGGQLFIREDAANNQVAKYQVESEEEEEGAHGAAGNKPHVRITPKLQDKPEVDGFQQRRFMESGEELELAPLPQLIPPSPSDERPYIGTAVVHAAESPLTPPSAAVPASSVAAAAAPSPASPSRAVSVQWQMACSSNEGTTDAAASSADDGALAQDGFHRPALGPASPSAASPQSLPPIHRPAQPLGRLRIPKSVPIASPSGSAVESPSAAL
jgi:hypothetical protein